MSVETKQLFLYLMKLSMNETLGALITYLQDQDSDYSCKTDSLGYGVIFRKQTRFIIAFKSGLFRITVLPDTQQRNWRTIMHSDWHFEAADPGCLQAIYNFIMNERWK